ncbi:hypothetical protein [uncultured Acinetobacter sp.]|uniref:hypothetical protein n=1 Tax=uncultured Acinetobacter sp. TaxID=165433 RepID=UPI002586135B|nr:hypothetical protein [uncultured Acinetobacter sp.]
MNKNKFFIILSFFTLLACVDAQSAEPTKLKMGTSAIQLAAQTKCTHDIDDFAAWKVASKLMTKNQKQQKEKQICKCVGKNAPTVLSPSELALAAVDSKARTALTGVAVAKTMNACVSEVIK